jgi:predicted PurR-regulated permease PerM
MPARRRRYVLAGLLGAVALLTAYLLFDVLSTVFFAVTVAYVLYPIRRSLAARVGPRVAATACTLSAFVVGVALVAPLVGVLYFRRGAMFSFLRQLPDTVTFSVGEFVHTVDIAALRESSRGVLENVAVGMVSALPAIALKLFLFTLIVYALLLRPSAVRTALLRPVQPRDHDIVFAFHERIKSILYAIYVLQAAVAFGTFLIALVVFWVLGYL